MRKKLLSYLLMVCMVVSFVPIKRVAADDFTINNLDDFKEFATNFATYATAKVTLTDSFVLDEEANGMLPLGGVGKFKDRITYDETKSTPFKGIFDGGGHTIKGFTFNTSEDDDNNDLICGLFGVVDGGTVKNLNLADVNLNTDYIIVGAAIGLMVGGAKAEKITVDGTVTGNEATGGIVGYMIIDGTIKGCTNKANVTANNAYNDMAGGIVGIADYTESDSEMTISGCNNEGKINCAYAAGGIVGWSAATIFGCSNSNTVKADEIAGGIVGAQVSYGTVENNTNVKDGTVSANTAGGIVGLVLYQNFDVIYKKYETIQVVNNSNEANVVGTGPDSSAGGIIGYLFNQATVTGNKNTAVTISCDDDAPAGIVGYANTTDVDKIPGAKLTITNNVSTTTAIDGSWLPAYYVDTEDGNNLEDAGDEFVASIVDDRYITLENAFASADNGSTIKLLSDTNIDSTIEINKTCTLDLNGQTIVMQSEEYPESPAIYVAKGGYLTIDDSGENGEIIATYRVVSVDGWLTLKGGTLDCAMTPSDGNKKNCDMINVAIWADKDVTQQFFGMSGGALTQSSKLAEEEEHVYAISIITDDGDHTEKFGQISVSISSGHIDGELCLDKAGSTSISGGSFAVDFNNDYLADNHIKQESDGGLITVVRVYTVTFTLEPDSATVKVTKENGETINPKADYPNVYEVPAARYNYEVSAENYVTKRGTFTIDATDHSEGVSLAGVPSPVEITISELPTGLTATYGQKLSDVRLPDGWTWNAPDTSVGDAGEKTFPATYTQGDVTVNTQLSVTVSMDKSNWGTAVTNNGVTNYVSSDGTTAVEVDKKGSVWLKAGSGNESAWFGLNNSAGIFRLGSKFWVRNLNSENAAEDWVKYYAQMDDEHKALIDSGKLMIFLIGVADPDGKEYTTDLGGSFPVYVQIDDDWSTDNLQALYIVSEATDEVVNVSCREKVSYPGGESKFAVLTLTHFSPYALYDKVAGTSTDGSQTDSQGQNTGSPSYPNEDADDATSDDDSDDDQATSYYHSLLTGDQINHLSVIGIACLMFTAGVLIRILAKKKSRFTK